MLENKRFKVIKRDKPEGILHHESFNNNVCVDLPLLVLQMFFYIANVLIELDTHMVVMGNKVSNKIVAIVCRWLKTGDDAVFENERFEIGVQDWIHHHH